MKHPELVSAVAQIISLIVHHPDSVRVVERESEDVKGKFIRIYAYVHDDDKPRLIGSHGVNADALRRVATLAGWKFTDERVYLQIVSGKWEAMHAQEIMPA